MAITSGAQAASATPATDQYNLLATALTAAGWIQETTRTYTAAIMGTTAACKVWFAPSVTSPAIVTSGVYTGLLLSIEVDDANARLRFRCMEVFDSSLSATPSSNTKWAAPGNNGGVAITPTANYAVSDSFVAHFQAQANGQTVGWVGIPVGISGFDYWLGANATKVFYANNVAGAPAHVVLGRIEYLGTSGGSTACFLLASGITSSSTNGSWTMSASSCAATVRVSREPLIAVSTTVAFVYTPNPLVPMSGNVAAMGAVGTIHQWLSPYVIFPVYLHGQGSTTSILAAGRGLLSTLSEFVCSIVVDTSVSGARASVPALGDEVTASGVTYLSLGVSGLLSSGTNNQVCGTGLLVNESQF